MGKITQWGKILENSKQKHSIRGLNLVYICIFMLEDMRGENVFAPYYKILPQNVAHFPIFWNADDKKYLESKAVEDAPSTS